MSTKDETEIILEVNGITDIKYEKPENFTKSVQYKAYDKAAAITKEIIKDNNRFYSMKYGESTGGTDLRNSEQIYNIIFFTGNRGTGKTSVMLSYMEFLKDYYRVWKSPKPELGFLDFGDKNFMFTGLEYIDASSLDNKEDILGSILSKMLKKWNDEEWRSQEKRGIRRKENYEFRKRQIHMRFNKVYENLKNLRSEKNLLEKDSDMFLETLENLSLTWNLKQSFQELIAAYLDIMEYSGTEEEIKQKNHFLVISIDDLDMNISHGFELLEQIRKYLMVPNVIVLLSANFEQLEKICNNYYASEFRDIKGDEETKTYIKTLSREYLEKMVPIQRQVTLFSGKKWEFFNQLKVKVQYCDNRIQGKDKSGDDKQGENNKGTVEEIVRNDFITYFGAVFMCGGKSLYYLAAETLREFCVWINQIKKLNELNGLRGTQDDKILELYGFNLKWFWNEEFPRLCQKYLSLSEHKVFATLDLLKPKGQIKFLKERFCEGNLLKSEDVSLLDLLADKREGTMENQTFASICMIYFTIKLAEMITKVQLFAGKEKKEQEKSKLMEYFDGGIWGVWEKKMIRPLAKAVGNDFSFVRIGYTDFKKDNKCLEIVLDEFHSSEDSKFICNYIKTHEKLLKDYQYMLLFYNLRLLTDIEDNAEGEHIWKLDKESKRLQLTNTYSGTFCFSNFVLNIYEGAKLVNRFLKELPELLYVGNSKKTKTEVDSAVKEISIIKDLEKWDREWEEKPLLPLSDIEYLINTGKKIQEKLGSGVIGHLDEANYETIIIPKAKTFFYILKESLEEYDNEEAEMFTKCPIVKRIFENNSELLKMVAKGINLHKVPYEPSEEEREWGTV